MSYRVVHYINQFFANIGGEEMAHVPPELREGRVGPGMAFEQAWKGEAEIVNTIVCGDSYFAEHEKEAKAQILAWVEEIKPDLFVAGPAFNAGRYGYACANICAEVQEKLGVREVVIHPIGPVIGAHSGPGTVALFFLGTKR